MVPINDGGKPGTRTDDPKCRSPVEYYSAGVVSLLVTVLALAFFYHAIVTMARPLYLLSTTAIVFVFLACWAITWLTLEIIWGWGSGRFSEA